MTNYLELRYEVQAYVSNAYEFIFNRIGILGRRSSIYRKPEVESVVTLHRMPIELQEKVNLYFDLAALRGEVEWISTTALLALDGKAKIALGPKALTRIEGTDFSATHGYWSVEGNSFTFVHTYRLRVQEMEGEFVLTQLPA